MKFLLIFLIFSFLVPFFTNTFGSIEEHCRCSEMVVFEEMAHSGTFKSPGFPDYYCGSLNCGWHIVPAENGFVSAKVDQFEEADFKDHLQIFQTQWNGTNLLMARQIYTGGFYASSIHQADHFFSSLGGGLFFNFTTKNKNHTYPGGFQISFQRHSKDDPINSPCPEPFHFATENPQNLPQLNANFRQNSICAFVINSSESIKLTLNHFEEYSIMIFETEDLFDKISHFHFMRQQRPILLNSRTSSLTLSITKSSTNFSYDIKFLQTTKPQICKCFPTELALQNKSLELLSPGYPFEYCHNLNCLTKISLKSSLSAESAAGENDDEDPAINVLRIRFNNFTILQYAHLRLYSIVQFSQEKSAFASQALINTRYDGFYSLKQFTFDFPQFGLEFVSNAAIDNAGIGFNFTIEAYKKERECICPNAPENILLHQNYSATNLFDARKCKSMDCFWRIQPPPNSTFKHLFLWFNYSLMDETEKLFISDSLPGSIMKFDFNPNYHARFDQQYLEIQHFYPITIWYHREWPDDMEMALYSSSRKREISFYYEWHKGCQCGPKILNASVEHWQFLPSPGYPDIYCRLEQCFWRLDAPQGHHLLLNITKFSIAKYDELYIMDGTTNTFSEKNSKIFRGQMNFSTPYNNTKNQLSLAFTVYGDQRTSSSNYGFEIWFKAVPNDELITEGGNDSFWQIFILNFLLLLLLLAIAVVFVIYLAMHKSNGIGQVRILWSTFWHPPIRRENIELMG